MATQPSQNQNDATIQQPLAPELVDPQQRAAHQRAIATEDLAMNPGDRVDDSLSLQEKAQQVAISTAGGDEVVPAYFIVETPEGDQEALHHVRDAERISDVIRQARTDENGDRTWW